MIGVYGAQGNPPDVESFLKKLETFSQGKKTVIQVFNADMIYGKQHLLSAAEHALRAFRQKTNTTNSLAKEVLLYAAGERQIQKALKKIGINRTTSRYAFILIDDTIKDAARMKDVLKMLFTTFHLTRDDKILEGDYDTLKRFGITDNEIRTVSAEKYGDLILEKVALVDIIK